MKKLFKEFSTYVSLSIIGMIGISLYILIDTFFISYKLGALGMASLNIVIPVYSLIQSVGLMLGVGAASRFSILKGQEEAKEANNVFTNAFYFALLISSVFSLLGFFLSANIASLLGANEETLYMAKTYIKVIMVFAPFFVSNNIYASFIRNDGNPRLAMVAVLASSLTNTLLDYVFMFPLNMGMFGASLATAISPMVSLLILSTHFIRKKNSFKLVKSRLLASRLLDFFKLGLSSFVMEVSSGLVLVVFNLIILRIEGNLGIASYGVIVNLAIIVIAIFAGISQGIQPLVSKNYGKGNFKNLKSFLSFALITSLIFSLIVYIFSFLQTDLLVSIFNREGNQKVYELSKIGIRIYFIGFFFAGLNIVFSAFLSATESTRRAFTLSVLRGSVLIIPLAFILAKLLGMIGIWLSFLIAEFLVFIFALLIYKKELKQRAL